MAASSSFHFVHPDEVSDFFHQIGLHEEFLKGEIYCNFCEEIIGAENFKAVTRCRGQLIFVCDKSTCYEDFLTETSERQR